MSDYKNISGLSYQPAKLKNVSEEEALKMFPEKYNKDWQLYEDCNYQVGFVYKKDLEPFELEFEITVEEVVKLSKSLEALIKESVDINKIKLFSITWYNGSDNGFNF